MQIKSDDASIREESLLALQLVKVYSNIGLDNKDCVKTYIGSREKQ